MNKLKKYMYQSGGLPNNLTIVEDGEYIKDNQGKVGKITNIPSHDDNELIIDNQVQKVPKGKGGQGISNVESVLSATHENRNQSDDTYTQADEDIKIKPQEALQLAEQLNLSIKRPLGSISPSKLMDKLLESREKLVSKYKNIDKEIKSEQQANSFTSNVAVLNSIPSPEDIYDFVFSNQENSKSENSEMYAQTGKSKEYWKNFDPSTYDSGKFTKSHLIKNPKIQSIPLNPNIGAFAIFDSNNPDVLTTDIGVNNMDIITHENTHRNNYLLSPGDRDINYKMLQKRMNTPPYKKEIYNTIGNPEELDAYFSSENDLERENIINNFVSPKDRVSYLENKYTQYQIGGKNVIHNGKPMYQRKDGKIVKKGIWSNSYLSKKQTGGRLQQFPTMDGSKPVALVNTPQGVKKVNMIDNRTISMDDMYNRDSVQIQGNKAVIVKKNPLKKFIK
jgi:hypothetical protein